MEKTDIKGIEGITRIGQSTHSRFARENHNRHRSERLIDRYLVKSENEGAMKYLEKLKLLKKINQKFNEKALKEQDDLQKQEEEKKQKEKEELREKYKEVDHYKALLRIMKHINKKDKFSKWLGLLSELLKRNIDFFCQNTLLNVFDALVRHESRAENEEDRQILQDLYSMFCQYVYYEQDQFKPEQLRMLENYIIPIHIESQFFTDDTYQFIKASKALENVFEDLEDYTEEQDKYLEDFNDSDRVKTFLKPADSEEKNELGIIQNNWIYGEIVTKDTDGFSFYNLDALARRKYFFGVLKVFFPLYRYAWAKGTVKRLLQKIYRDSDKISDTERQEVNKMLETIEERENDTSRRTTKDFEFLDKKIMSTVGKTDEPVKDIRGSRLVVDGLGAWNSRQTNN